MSTPADTSKAIGDRFMTKTLQQRGITPPSVSRITPAITQASSLGDIVSGYASGISEKKEGYSALYQLFEEARRGGHITLAQIGDAANFVRELCNFSRRMVSHYAKHVADPDAISGTAHAISNNIRPQPVFINRDIMRATAEAMRQNQQNERAELQISEAIYAELQALAKCKKYDLPDLENKARR